MNVIKWERPPEEHGNSKPKPPSKFQPIVDALKARPGEWALIADGKSPGSAGNLSHRIRSGVGVFGPRGAFEAKAVGPAGGSDNKVYARYVRGDGGTPNAQ